MHLAPNTGKLTVTTGSAGTIHAEATWADADSSSNPATVTVGGLPLAVISGAATTDLVPVNSSATKVRKVKELSVYNAHASISNLITLSTTDGTNTVTEWSGTLLPKESIKYFPESIGWQFLDANGNPKIATPKLNTVVTVSGSDVVNASTSFADCTGLTVAVKSGKKYVFEAHLFYQTNATTTGAQFGVNGSFTSLIAGGIRTETPAVASALISAGVVTAADTADQAQTTGPGTNNSYGLLIGEFVASADMTFAIRTKSEVAVAAGLTVKVGSWLRVQEADL